MRFSVSDDSCKDDPNWYDAEYGDGKGKCVDMTTDWCQNHGEYSSEAKRACPKKCGVCGGKLINKIVALNFHN